MSMQHTVELKQPFRTRSKTQPAPGQFKQANNPLRSKNRRLWITVAVLSIAIVGWAVMALVVENARLAFVAPRLQIGVEAATALSRLFAALVLFLFPSGRHTHRLHWVAAGLAITGAGGILFGYLPATLGMAVSLNTSIYALMAVRYVSIPLFAIGLIPARPPRYTPRTMLLVLGIFAVVCGVVISAASVLPSLASTDQLLVILPENRIHFPSMTPWYYVLAAVPFVLSGLCVVGAMRAHAREHLSGWLCTALVLQAGALLHTLIWPSTYSPVVTSADVLRLVFAATVLVAGILELRRIANEHAALLATEQKQRRRLEELARLKAEFSSMVVHELGNPLAAIRGFADLLAIDDLDPATRTKAVTVIRHEAEVLETLIADVRAAAQSERSDFAVVCRSVPLRPLIDEAVSVVETLPGKHPLSVSPVPDIHVWADPERIRQVLLNLLSNAAKYSDPETPIRLRIMQQNGCVKIAVADHGYGIHPNDLDRIFEKFGRGRDQAGQKKPGVGLGLYLSRRIVQAHGTDLEVSSKLGVGSVFAFELEVMP